MAEDGSSSYGVLEYVTKFQGRHLPTPPYIKFYDALSAFVASFVSVAILAALQYNAMVDGLHDTQKIFIIGSFGATAVLLYGVTESDLSQPRNCFGGHVISAFIGVCIQKIFAACDAGEDMLWLSCALSISISITAMNLLRCLHPPAGATAILAILPSSVIQDIGWLYIGLPTATSACIMIIVAVIFNNIPRQKRWPKSWI